MPDMNFFNDARMREMWSYFFDLMDFASPMVMLLAAIVAASLMMTIIVNAVSAARNKKDDDDDDSEIEIRRY